jgi:hypothetical protein
MNELNEKIIPIRNSRQMKQIVALIKRFPDFSSKVPKHILHGSINFNAVAFDQWASSPSSLISKAERIIAQFILGVFDQYSNDQWKCGKFDIFDAASKLSSENLYVISVWVKDPFFV